MPCPKCNTNMIYIAGYPTCPKCEHVQLVPCADALKMYDYLSQKYHGLILEKIQQGKKQQIIFYVFRYREKLIREFTRKYSTLNIVRLYACSLLIRQLIEHNKFLEQKEWSESDLEQLIDYYEIYVRCEENRSMLQTGTMNMIRWSKYDLNQLEELSFKDVPLFPNEQYNRIISTFYKYNIMDADEANAKLEDWKKDVIPVKFGSKKIHSARETITRFYEFISTLYVAFFRTRLSVLAFGSFDTKNITITPLQLKRFVSLFPIQDDKLDTFKIDQFFNNVRLVFENKVNQFFSNFVISEENPNAYPLFLQIGDTVLMSQAFTELYCYLLHAIIDKKLFDQETEKRSKIFESKIVTEYFQKRGYHYISNYTVKNKLEIDGIAISDSKVYVIEVKGWGSKKLLEESSSQKILTREIKDAIDGKHFVHASNKNKRRVSLPKKVTWVTKNRSKFKIQQNVPIRGLLIINEAPTINKYNGCKIKFVNDFES